MKKAWEKPEVVVLVRSQPEEVVLGGCKSASVDGPASGSGSCTAPPCFGSATS